MRIYRHVTANAVRLEPYPFKRELAMQAYLVENEGVLALDDDAFSGVEIIDSEMSLKEGRTSRDTDGRIDVLATFSQEYIAVVELKLGQLEEPHLGQLEDYLKQRQQILERYPGILGNESTPKWLGLLVGTTISAALADKLRLGHSAHDVPIAALTVQRFRGSDGSVLVTTDTYFNYPSTARDITKYSFEGGEFGKGRLVLAVVKRHVERHPSVTFAGLEQDFPRRCQGSSGVFATIGSASEIVARTSRKRHFMEPSELIQLADSTVAVSSQWGTGNIETFIDQARRLGYKIEPVTT